MIPILYEMNETNFTSNGVGRLFDCTRCEVTEEKNGNYLLELDYPVSGKYFKELSTGKIILATHDKTGETEPFDIYSISKPSSGSVTVYGHHISYRLQKYIAWAGGTVGGGPAMYLNTLNNGQILGSCPFVFSTDIPDSQFTDKTKQGYMTTVDREVRTVLLDEDTGLLSHRMYGVMQDAGFGQVGAFKFNRFNVQLLKNRGQDNGVKFRRDKNVKVITESFDISELITGVVPFWSGQDAQGNTVFKDLKKDAGDTFTDGIVYGEWANDYPYQNTVLYDMSSVWEQPPTRDELIAGAHEYLQIVEYNMAHSKSYNVELSSYDENLKALYDVNLCDTVILQDEKMGLNVSLEVVQTVYDVLEEKYTSVQVGSLAKKLSTALKKKNDIWVENCTTTKNTQTAIQSVSKKNTTVTSKVTPETDSSAKEIASVAVTESGGAVKEYKIYQSGGGASFEHAPCGVAHISKEKWNPENVPLNGLNMQASKNVVTSFVVDSMTLYAKSIPCPLAEYFDYASDTSDVSVENILWEGEVSFTQSTSTKTIRGYFLCSVKFVSDSQCKIYVQDFHGTSPSDRLTVCASTSDAARGSWYCTNDTLTVNTSYTMMFDTK